MTFSAVTVESPNVNRSARTVDKPILNKHLAQPNNKRSTFDDESPGGPPTKKRFVTPDGGQKKDQSCIKTDSLELAARNAVRSMFPVSHSNGLAETDCHENVTRLVTRFMKKHENLPERSTSPHDLATKVCKSLLDSFPDRSLFHLLQRWGRKKNVISQRTPSTQQQS